MSIVVKQNGQMENNISANVQLYTIRGIVPRNPGFIIRIALPVFLLILCAMAAITWFVKYPEIIKATTIVTGKNADDTYNIRVILPPSEMRKIAVGQQLRLQFAEYPRYKVGFVPAIVKRIVGPPTGQELTLQVQLLQGLTTTENKQIPYRPGLRAESIIFIKDLRLLQRMLNSSSRVFH